MQSLINNLLLIMNFCKPLKESLFCDSQISLQEVENSLEMCSDKFLYLIDGFLTDYLEPLELPNAFSSFNHTLLGNYYEANVSLTNGFLKNIPSVTHNGKIIFFIENKKIKIIVPFTFLLLMTGYTFEVNIMESISASGGIRGTIKNIDIICTISFDYVNLAIELEDFEIIDASYLDIEIISPYFLIDWLLNFVTDIFTFILKRTLLTRLSEVIEESSTILFHEINAIMEKVTKSPAVNILLKRLYVISASDLD